MSDKSNIEWTDATWNPMRGCVKVSPGCKHCYAETFAERFRGVAGHAYERGFDPREAPDQLGIPLRWKKPRRIFVNSMSDLFGEFVTDEYLAACFAIMYVAHQHTYQALTKRSGRLVPFLTWLVDPVHGLERWRAAFKLAGIDEVKTGLGPFPMTVSPPEAAMALGFPWPLPNLHIGVSVEDRRFGVPRIDDLRKAPARVRFLSIEPLLEDLGELDLAGIHQVILGGESGNGARACDLRWVRKVKAQAEEQKVPVFVKQLGAAALDVANGIAGAKLHVPRESAKLFKIRLKHPKGGDMAEWAEDLRVRQPPALSSKAVS